MSGIPSSNAVLADLIEPWPGNPQEGMPFSIFLHLGGIDYDEMMLNENFESVESGWY